MSDLFGSDSEKLQKENVLKEDFGWEVPIELVPLPSAGLLYGPDSSLYKKETVKIKSMTAREEDILMSAAFIKEGTALDHVANSCIIDNVNINEMTVGDKNAILTAIRITGYGKDYKVNVRCQSCGAFNNVNIDLSSLPIKRLKIKPHKDSNLFMYTLPVTKKRVLFEFTTIKKDKQRKEHIKNLENANMKNSVGQVTLALEYLIHSIEGITDRNKIKHFILNMPALDAKSLRNYINDHEPGIDMTDNFVCKSCNSDNTFNIPITSDFFWPR
jgi:hypothetical protein